MWILQLEAVILAPRVNDNAYPFPEEVDSYATRAVDHLLAQPGATTSTVQVRLAVRYGIYLSESFIDDRINRVGPCEVCGGLGSHWQQGHSAFQTFDLPNFVSKFRVAGGGYAK